MKCEKCGLEWSDDVYRLHIQRCKAAKIEENEPVKLSKPELKSILDEAGVKYTARMGKDDLQALVDTIATGEQYLDSEV